MTDLKTNFRNGIYGVATGDALGTPVQFCSREEVRRYPITGMRDDGTYRLPGGTWSDDTSMTLALAESLGRCKKIDYEDVMSNFAKWNNCGKFTPKEAALWCFLNTSNYKDCVLKAVNLGEDTDTIGAIAGGLAGIYYGEIPQDWLDELRGKEVIENSIADMVAFL